MNKGIYFPPSLQKFEPKRMVFSTWVDHLPFAYDLVEAIRPRTVVELGVYNGLSFFHFLPVDDRERYRRGGVCHRLLGRR